jgi:hypothetical protein
MKEVLLNLLTTVSPIELDVEHFDVILETYHQKGLDRQAKPLLDSLWKISLPFVPSEPFFEELAKAERFGDWRKIVKEWKSINEKSPKFRVQF